MRRNHTIKVLAAFCAIALFCDFSAAAAPPKGVDASDLDSAGDHPGAWMLEYQNTDKKGPAAVGFVRLLRSRDARGVLKYDEIVMHSDKRYPFGLWDTYLGKCDSHELADIWVGDLTTDGDARGLPVAKIEYVQQPKHFIGYETLEKFCNGETTMQTIADPVAYAHDFLKR